VKYCKSIQTLIIKNIPCAPRFWLSLSSECPEITTIEILNNQTDALKIAPVILSKFPKIDHLIIALNKNYLHTQWNPNTIHRVIELLENNLNSPDVDIFQSWITLQYLYRKVGDPDSAERIIQKYGADYHSLGNLKFMTDRVLSGICTRPKDTTTCYFWNHCWTCKLVGFNGLCGYCANGTCHKGHKTMFKYISSGAYCDCLDCGKTKT